MKERIKKITKKQIVVALLAVYAVLTVITVATGTYGCYGAELNNTCFGFKSTSDYTNYYEWCKLGIPLGPGCMGVQRYDISTGCVGVKIGELCAGAKLRLNDNMGPGSIHLDNL